MNMQGVKVGDRVQVFNTNWSKNRRHEDDYGQDGVVTKVGRMLFTVEYGLGYQSVFRIENGQLNDKNFGYHTWVKTPEQAEEDIRRGHLKKRLRELGVEVNQFYLTRKLEAIIKILEED